MMNKGLRIRRPFYWGTDRKIFSAYALGAMLAFSCTFSLQGTNQLVAQRVGKELVSTLVLVFYFIGLAGTIGGAFLCRVLAKRRIIPCGLALMAVNFTVMTQAHHLWLMVLCYIGMAVGFYPTMSAIANLCWASLPENDDAGARRGRSTFASINFFFASIGPLAVVLLADGFYWTWFTISLVVLVMAVVVILCRKDELATEPDDPPTNQLPFYQQLVDLKVLRVTWPLALVVTAQIGTNVFLVFNIGIVASYVVFFGEMTNAMVGPVMTRLTEKIASWSPERRAYGDRWIVIVSLLFLMVALICISTGIIWACFVGSGLIGICYRASSFSFGQLGSYQMRPEQQSKSSYTNLTVISSGQCAASLMQLTSMGLMMFLLPIPLILIACGTNFRDLKRVAN